MSSSSRARLAAERWIKTLKLPPSVSGQTIDLREPAKLLTVDGRFRTMVLQAAARYLKANGAAEVLLPPLE